MVADYAIVVIYLLIIVIIGLQASGKVKSIRDFSLFNNRYGVFALVTRFSTQASSLQRA